MTPDEAILAGPLLVFRGLSATSLRLAALVVTAGERRPPPLEPAGGEAVAPERLASRTGRTLWRYEFALPAAPAPRAARYALGEEAWEVAISGPERVRVAFTACNGQEEGDARTFDQQDRNERWRHLLGVHEREPFHLLLQGGDQLYADDLWRVIPELARWGERPRQARLGGDLAPETLSAIDDFYFERYCRMWGQSALRSVLARIPSLMMWDDHDIFDGWGSHPARYQRSPTFRAIFRAAREHFALFQLGCRPGDLAPGFGDPGGGHFGWAYRLGPIGVIGPDLRSERTRWQVMGPAGRSWFGRTLERLSDSAELLIVSTVPLANLNLSFLERMLVWLPGQQRYQDDLRDQWRSFRHRREWRAVVTALVDVARTSRAHISLLSGEIHLGAFGLFERDGARVHQLVSSGVVHPPPPAWLASLFDRVARRRHPHVGEGVRMRMLPVPGLGERYLAARNWLELDWREGRGLEATWHADRLMTAGRVRLS